MTEKHTLGPWKIKGDGLLTLTDAHDNTLGCVYLPLGTTPHYKRVPERNANASLIIASPDMLEELVKARKIIVKWCSYQGETEAVYNEYLNSIDTVILKARGQQ